MKYSIKRKSKIINKIVYRSAFLLVSAFAVFSSVSVDAREKKDNKEDILPDSVFTARYVFERLHSSALEILPKTTRLDMLDYWDVDSVYKASNIMEGLSWIETVSPTYMKVRITSASTLEIKILPAKHGLMAMTINTIGDDVQALDSKLHFYNEQLEELPADKIIELPKVKDFFEIPKGSATKMKEIEDMIPFPTIEFIANRENDNLEARLTVEKYMNQDDWHIAKLFMKPNILFKWEKNKYKLEK